MGIDRRAACVIGVASQTYRDLDAPEPLDMWAEMLARAAEDSGGTNVLRNADSLATTYCQTWQYDDPLRRLADLLDIEPRSTTYMSVGGTSGQQLVNAAADRIAQGEADVVAIASAEALATHAAARKRGERRRYRFKPQDRRPFPFESPLHPAEVAHDLTPALNAFALFDNARRAHLGATLGDYRKELGAMLAPMTRVAATNPDAWFRIERTPDDIVEARPDNRMAASPYTKYMAAVMNVDMAAAIIVASEAAADRLGVPNDRRVYLRGWCFAKDPTYIAEHPDLHSSPAMRAASCEAMRIAGVAIDDVSHLDLYSCFGASLNFACDALGIATTDRRGLTVTGGLPYHGGPGSGYMTHAIAQMVRVLREHPGEFGLTSGVGMINTKHVFGVYSSEPGDPRRPDEGEVQRRLDAGVAAHRIEIAEACTATGSVVAYTVIYGRDGTPESAPLVVDLGGGRRAYAKVLEPEMLASIERDELIGSTVEVEPHPFSGPGGERIGHRARLR